MNCDVHLFQMKFQNRDYPKLIFENELKCVDLFLPLQYTFSYFDPLTFLKCNNYCSVKKCMHRHKTVKLCIYDNYSTIYSWTI